MIPITGLGMETDQGCVGTDQGYLFHLLSCCVLKICFYSGVISWENNYIIYIYMQFLLVVH